MKKIHLIGIAALAVCAFGVAAVASASAATLQWLANTKPIAAALASKTKGEITLGSTNAGGFKVTAEVLCSGIFVGSVGPGAEDETTSILNLAETEEITLAKPISCTNVKNCESAQLSPANLPWLTRLELMGTEASPEFLDVLEVGAGGANPGWEVECTVPLFGKISEVCTSANTGAVLKNVAGGVEGKFVKETIASCTVGGVNTGFVESAATDEAGLTTLGNGEALTVQYE